MKVGTLLLLLSGLLLTHATPIYVKEGDNIHLRGSPTHLEGANAAYFWAKERDWQPGSFDKITEPGNCSFRPHYENRITRCALNLTIANSRLGDSGTYRLRSRNGTHQNFTVVVFGSLPVLTPVRMEEYRLTIRCLDLRNPHSEIEIVARDMDPHPTVPHYFSMGYFYQEPYALIQQAGVHDRGVDFSVMCCATFHNISTCTNWTYIWVDVKLDGGRAQSRQRPWCRDRNADPIRDIDMGTTHFGPLLPPTCLQTDFVVFNNTRTRVCESVQSNLSLYYKQPVRWKKDRDFGGVRGLGMQRVLRLNGTLNETGLYHTSSGENFEVVVHPTLKVTIKILQILDYVMYLKCEHTGGPNSEIKWVISGQYSSYEIGREKILVFKADCWYSSMYWYTKFGIYCQVSSGPWRGSSRWFLGEYWRTSHNRYGEKFPELQFDLPQ